MEKKLEKGGLDNFIITPRKINAQILVASMMQTLHIFYNDIYIYIYPLSCSTCYARPNKDKVVLANEQLYF